MKQPLVALCGLLLIEGVGGSLWHGPLLKLATSACQLWASAPVQTVPIQTLQSMLDDLIVPLKATHPFWAGVIGLVAGLPIVVVVGVVLELVWLIPYLVVYLMLNLVRTAVSLHLLPALAPFPLYRGVFGTPVRKARACTVRSAREAIAPPPARADEGCATLHTMGFDRPELFHRKDPYTRTRFEFGERFVICGGRCARAYKLVTCEALAHRCPIDGSSLRTREAQSPSANEVRQEVVDRNVSGMR